MLLCLALIVLSLPSLSAAQQKKRDANATQLDQIVTPTEAAQLEAVITTSLGVIRFEFAPGKAPKHVQQFIKLARSGFYDGSAFSESFSKASFRAATRCSKILKLHASAGAPAP